MYDKGIVTHPSNCWQIQTHQFCTSGDTNGKCDILNRPIVINSDASDVHACSIMYRSILWPVLVLWPDVVFTMSLLSQFIQNPGPAHWETLECVIIYLRLTKDLHMVTICRVHQNACRRLLQYGLGRPKAPSLHLQLLISCGNGCDFLELKEAALCCALKHWGRIC